MHGGGRRFESGWLHYFVLPSGRRWGILGTVSRENVELVRRVFNAAQRGDTGAVLSLYDPDVVWDASRTTRGAITGRSVRGREELLKWLREWYGAWETVDDELEEVIDAGDDTVISVMLQRGRGRRSGIELENRLAAVWTIRAGQVVRVVWLPSREQAVEIAGAEDEPADARPGERAGTARGPRCLLSRVRRTRCGRGDGPLLRQ